MIYCAETTKENKKSIFLFCVRDDEELKQLMEQNNPTNDVDIDTSISNENTTSSGNTTDGSEESKDNNEQHNIQQQQECSEDCEYKNADKQIRPDSNVSLENNIESETADNGKKLNVIPAVHFNENTEFNTWDDYDCFKISQDDFFPSKVMDLDIQKLIITRFLNFYVGGKVPKGLRASDVVFAVISITPLTGATEEFIWHENEYKDNSSLFYITPEEKLNNDFKGVAKRANQISTLKDNIEKKKVNEKESKNNKGSPTCDNEVPSKSAEQNQDLGSTNSDSNKTLSNVDDEDLLSSYISDMLENMSIVWRGSKISSKTTQTSFIQYGPVENSAFISSCNKLLLAWEESEESRIMLKYFFGIIALTLMRGIVKGKKNIINTFNSEKFLNKLKFIHSEIKYSTPHESCIDKCCREFKLSDRHHKVMFAKMIFNSFRIDYMHRKGLTSTFYGLYNIFRMCVIDYITYYDMGIINLLKTIYGYVGPDNFSIILGKLKSEKIDHSMEQVRNFIFKYMKNDGKCLTYHWARYFDPKQFEYLSCTKSYAAAVVLAVFVEKMTRKSDVWRSGWVRSQQDDLDEYKKLAEHIYEDYKRISKSKMTLLCQQFFTTRNIDAK